MELNKTDLIALERCINVRIEKFGEKIYHYTSMSSFLGMIDNKELWLGNTGTMNDRKETVHFVDMLQKELELYKRKEFFEKVFQQIPMYYKYIFCFSKERDDAAQWERYADSAKGVCIAFNVKELCRCLYGYSDFMFRTVKYKESVEDSGYLAVIKNYFETGKIEVYKNEEELIKQIMYVGNVHKHPSFIHENEIRLTTMDNKEQAGMEYGFKKIGNVVKKVLILKPDEMGRDKGIGFENLIDEVIVGPRSQQNINVLQEYIQSKGFDKMSEHIIQSECPLR